ncbi:uncharacterized protein LOC129596250 isoform X2 [Paramacrobiotus metropolitanus]|uniref:uncharacterized protein LOC129596250 isoform X2 n=1 Tax=Paramacrobiotus metropolitanus TaxID=2943436 RepID=UPI00244638EE|nr:uncharacterized protein LOC129596250 isoform X2 [Paramacrobiotus metropolitanus]
MGSGPGYAAAALGKLTQLRRNPLPVVVIANLSARILASSVDYLHRLSRDIHFLCDFSFSHTPSKYCWRMMIMRDNHFQHGYFTEQLQWLYEKSRHHHTLPIMWTKHAALTHRLSCGLLDIQAANHLQLQKSSALTVTSKSAHWFSGLDGRAFLTKVCDGLLARLTTRQFEELMKNLTESVIQIERVLGSQEWSYGEVELMYTEEIICYPKLSDGSSYRYVVPLASPLQVWEAGLLVQFAIPMIRQQNAGNNEFTRNRTEITYS